MTTKQSSHVQQPRILDQGELDARIEKAVNQYKNSHASCRRVEKGILLALIKEVLELVEQGYKFNEDLPCLVSRSGLMCYLKKPEAMQEAEIEDITVEVETKLKAEIEAHNKAQIELLTIQLFEQEKAKEKKKQEEKEAKQLADARKAAETFFASIKEGK